MAEKAKAPAIRFKGFTDDWEQRKLYKISDSYSGGTPSVANESYYGGSIPFIRSGEINSYVTELFITSEALQNSSAKLVEKGDILYALYGATSGEVGISRINGAINQAILAIKPRNNHDSYFISQWLRREKANIVNTYLQGGQGNLSGNIVKELVISIPTDLAEQNKIGKLFIQLDNLITLHQRKFEKLQNVKKAMLEKMLPKNGSNIPEIRFAGFSNAWEQRQLGDASESFEYGLNAAATTYDGKNKYIRITDIDDSSRKFQTDDLTSPDTDLSVAEKYKLENGDILFARTGASVGKSYIYRASDGLVYYAGFLIRAKIKVEYDAEFVFQNTLTSDYDKFIQITSQRSGQPGVNAQEYSNFNMKVPSKAEQRKIGGFFRNLDNLITLHQRKLEKLQNVKKACLEKMFV